MIGGMPGAADACAGGSGWTSTLSVSTRCTRVPLGACPSGVWTQTWIASDSPVSIGSVPASACPASSLPSSGPCSASYGIVSQEVQPDCSRTRTLTVEPAGGAVSQDRPTRPKGLVSTTALREAVGWSTPDMP